MLVPINKCVIQMNIIKTNLDIFTTISIMNKYGKKLMKFKNKILLNIKSYLIIYIDQSVLNFMP